MTDLFSNLTLLTLLIAGLGWYLSMRQYFKIKAFKAGKESGNIFIEHSVKGPQYVFSGDFIEYFPITYLLRKLDDSEYNNYDDGLKKLYKQKAKYEFIFWICIVLGLVFTFISTGGKITSTGY